MKEIIVPFCGFYESIASAEIDSIIENDLIYMEEEAEEITKDEIDDLWLHMEYFDIKQEYAKQYVEWFQEKLQEHNINIFLKFKAIDSPREYNFTTDRIVCEISEGDLKILFKSIPLEFLEKTIKEHFTSRDGFHSFYSNNLEEWLEQPLLGWDHNQTGTLLTAFSEHILNEAAEMDHLEYVRESLYNPVSAAIDEALKKVRENKLD